MELQTISKSHIPLSAVSIGTVAQVFRLEAEGLQRRRLLDLGLVPGTVVAAVRKSPLGDPIAYDIRGARIALRTEESEKILVKVITQ
ncbi:FeoA family protein [Geosporobacter ferrireducens]|uniref:Iron transporter FeoA n=1 Tax=Geosporobacter ferrireducens TaxID=1424294 RepID=A0A1D8GL77_9FIRM|nr:FeoA family protein [Geosporobacter ferrireducens]AOT71648.1 iron transporter FeoA [Geosporobacter ferrireducens]